MFCDLHTHSDASDGTDAPGDIPRLAKQAGLEAIALTDHDTTAGLQSFLYAAKKARIKAVPGIELSADPAIFHAPSEQPARKGTLHILGYFIDKDDPDLAKIQVRLREARARRNPEMVARLQALGMKINYEEVITAAGGVDSANIIGRPHIAQVMLQKGYVKSIHEAFARYIGQGGVAYVRKDRLSADEAIDVIHGAGGLAVLAHPTQLLIPDPVRLDHAFATLKKLGLDGVETRHSDHEPADAELFTRLAHKYDLVTTGGSDYHGSRKTIELGSQKVPLSVYESLKKHHADRTSR